MPSVLFIGKKNDPYCEQAGKFLLNNFSNLEMVFGARGDPFPEEYKLWQGDFIISYLSPWIINETLLQRAGQSINLHPGPPEYPGIGCTNFAIYNGEKTFGVTCHHMLPRVDTGPIIAVRRFPLFQSDTVYSLTQRCYAHILVLFYEIMGGIILGEELPEAGEHWKRKPYRRSELNALCEISPDMPEDEIRRRVRATTFPGMPGPFVRVGGYRFILDAGD